MQAIPYKRNANTHSGACWMGMKMERRSAYFRKWMNKRYLFLRIPTGRIIRRKKSLEWFPSFFYAWMESLCLLYAFAPLDKNSPLFLHIFPNATGFSNAVTTHSNREDSRLPRKCVKIDFPSRLGSSIQYACTIVPCSVFCLLSVAFVTHSNRFYLVKYVRFSVRRMEF